MKKVLTSLLLTVITLLTMAQQPAKNDVILKLNGEEMTGKVLKINDNDLEFAYAGETLSYTVKKSDIMKITYASGRIEIFNKQTPPPAAGSQGGDQQARNNPGLEDHHNKVAILPFSFIMDGRAADDAISEQVQNECYSYMNKHAGVFTILNPRTTNTALIRAGINKENIKGYTMDDLCNLLGVEYVVDGSVSMMKTSQTSYQSNSGSSTSKDNDKNDNKNNRYNSYSYGTARQNYQTKLTLAIFNDKGSSVYDQNRASFWNTEDAYKSTLEYLLKRSPLYTK